MSLSGLLSTTGRQEIETRLVAEMGGYLRNTVRETQVTCQICATPVGPRYDLCRRCDQDRYRFCEELADLVVPVCYGIKGEQSGFQMYSYEDLVTPDPRSRIRLSMLLLSTLGLHGDCLEDALNQEVDRWAIVPSTRPDRPGEHPLRVVARQTGLDRRFPEIELAPRSDVLLDERVTSASRFAVTAGNVQGRHVLLIEDTWTSGTKCQSAALTLRHAGAATVTILAVARWLRPTEKLVGTFIKLRSSPGAEAGRCK